MDFRLASVGLAALVGLASCATPAPTPQAQALASTAATPAPARKSMVVAYRRLTEAQYRNVIRDAFGPAIAINAKFEPERREEGLQAVGNARLSITTAGLEQYQAAARAIADQVVDGKDRQAQLGCAAPPEAAAQKACAYAFIDKRGPQLCGRPLTTAERASYTGVFDNALSASGDFNKSLKLTLVGMLMSPEFLFRVERAETDPTGAGGLRLDGYTKASRLAYLLWNSGPDAELIAAAQSGDIHTEAGLAKQVDRLLASPRLEDGVRAFFSDVLEFEAFDTLTKDTATYPKFSGSVADSAREETLKFLVDHLVKKNADYRDIFTSRETYVDRTLAYVYNVPYLSADKWTKVTFPDDAERSGILTQVTFLALNAHPGSSSPTIRGVKLNEIFLCVQIPQPPPDVDFSKVQALEKGTVRTRLLDHMTNPGCAGCHRISDPVGLALERFDGLGQHRANENGELIDVSAELGAKKFSGAQGLGQYLHDDPRVVSCLVKKANSYGVGRTSDGSEGAYLARVEKAFASSGYRLPTLFRTILTDPEFYRVVEPKASAPTRTASLSASVGDQPSSGEKR